MTENAQDVPATITEGLMFNFFGDLPTFAKAFIAAQKNIEGIKKGTKNDHFKSKYADLAEVNGVVIPAMNDAGIGVIQIPGNDGDLITVTTLLLHESGSGMTGLLKMRPTKTDPQGAGSAITYGRRYSILSMSGAAPEDDDGNAASGTRQHQSNAVSEVEKAAIRLLTGQSDPDAFKEVWAKNKDGWKENFDPPAYARVVAAMKQMAEKFQRRAAAQERTDALGISEDEIPDFQQ